MNETLFHLMKHTLISITMSSNIDDVKTLCIHVLNLVDMCIAEEEKKDEIKHKLRSMSNPNGPKFKQG